MFKLLRKFHVWCLFPCVCFSISAQVVELTPGFNRRTSLTTVRKIHTPTLAHLDFAAYNKNPVRFDPQTPKFKSPTKKIGAAELTFGNLLSSISDSLTQTPLTADEIQNALAWEPMVHRLWKIVKDPVFMDITTKINGEKWADPRVSRPYQEISTAYLHHSDDGKACLWVKVDFFPWVKFLSGVTDEDADGFLEIYGELALDKVADTSISRIFTWITSDYCARPLSHDEFTDWITTLASYWYPAYNTDVIDLAGDTRWPTPTTDRNAIRGLRGMIVENPAAVVKANPFGKLLYNVYVVEGLADNAAMAAAVDDPRPALSDRVLDTAVSVNARANFERLHDELKPFGSYEAWAKKLTPVIENVKTFLASLPATQLGFKGLDDWLFFRKSLDYLVGGDLNVQSVDKNPIPHLVAFKKYLNDQGVGLLFVPIPNKEEVYYEKLPWSMPSASNTIINPYSRKFIRDAQDAGIEVIDLLPLFLQAKADDPKQREALYQRHDTHWTNRGLQIAATAIADRIKQYSWYPQASNNAVRYTISDTAFWRKGDIVERLPLAEQSAFSEVHYAAQQVRAPGGKLYLGSRNDPIMLIGDSFTGVFESVDCKSAGVGAHIAAKTGMPVDIITSWGGGPSVRDRVVRSRKNDMAYKRVVIYMMVARDLYNYSEKWEPLKIEK